MEGNVNIYFFFVFIQRIQCSADRWIKLEGTDCSPDKGAASIGALKDISVADCKTDCNRRLLCEGFVMKTVDQDNNGKCWLRKNITLDKCQLDSIYTTHLVSGKCRGKDSGCCTNESPCAKNDGDCDHDSQCSGNLVCGKNNCEWGHNDDCCKDGGVGGAVGAVGAVGDDISSRSVPATQLRSNRRVRGALGNRRMFVRSTVNRLGYVAETVDRSKCCRKCQTSENFIDTTMIEFYEGHNICGCVTRLNGKQPITSYKIDLFADVCDGCYLKGNCANNYGDYENRTYDDFGCKIYGACSIKTACMERAKRIHTFCDNTFEQKFESIFVDTSGVETVYSFLNATTPADTDTDTVSGALGNGRMFVPSTVYRLGYIAETVDRSKCCRKCQASENWINTTMIAFYEGQNICSCIIRLNGKQPTTFDRVDLFTEVCGTVQPSVHPSVRPTTPVPTSEQVCCGVTNSSTFQARIVGGIDAEMNEYPWIVTLRIITSRTGLCGGSLIASQWILTAQHCTRDVTGPNNIEVRLGDHKRDTREDMEKEVTVSKIINHSTYLNWDTDIALLKLSQPVSLKIYTPICLPEHTKNNDYIGKGVWVYGWGTMAYKGATPNTLQKAKVQVVSNTECDDGFRKQHYRRAPMVASQICAGSTSPPYKDSCQGDSGGPLSYSRNGAHEQIGIVSFGKGCAIPGLYGVYAYVGYLRDWIENTINTNGGDILPTPC